jgi:hypothetical protein
MADTLTLESSANKHSYKFELCMCVCGTTKQLTYSIEVPLLHLPLSSVGYGGGTNR